MLDVHKPVIGYSTVENSDLTHERSAKRQNRHQNYDAYLISTYPAKLFF